MRVRIKKVPPALKHGAYSAITLLPGEDRAAFDKLHSDVIADLAPAGPLEDDIVYTLARYLWRKRNLNTFHIAELARDHCSALQSQLRPKSTMGQFNLDGIDSDEDEAACLAAEDQARRELGDAYQLVEIGKTATLHGLMEELTAEEHLDAMIDRCIKRLLLLKGLKSLPHTSPATPPLRISGPQKTA
jgi:hypothetical protein